MTFQSLAFALTIATFFASTMPASASTSTSAPDSARPFIVAPATSHRLRSQRTTARQPVLFELAQQQRSQPARAQVQRPQPHGQARRNDRADRSQTEHPHRPLVVSVNGQSLEGDTSAELLNGRIYVPVRAVLAALGIPSDIAESRFIGRVPGEPLIVDRGATVVYLGARRIALGSPAEVVNGQFYVPLMLLNDAFGAQTAFDPRAFRVEILCAVVTRARSSSGAETGTVVNVDRFSQPPSVSLSTEAGVRTITLPAEPKVVLSDLIAGTRSSGTIDDLHIGDVLGLQFASDGTISEVDDSFRSRGGTVAAASDQAVALSDGRLVVPDRYTTVSINGTAANLADVRVGDTVTVRSNPETLEIREVLVSRKAAVVDTSSNVVITQCTFAPKKALHANEELQVFVRGTPHGHATFDLGASVVGLPMTEISPGTYRGSYLVAPGANFARVAVIGRMTFGTLHADPVSADETFSAATVAPQVVDVAPHDGEHVAGLRPALFATYESPTGIDVDAGSVRFSVAGRDVTTTAVRRGGYAQYLPDSDLPTGQVTATVSVSDIAGNPTTRSWTFFVDGR